MELVAVNQDIPERVYETRKQWAANDAKRDAGLTEPKGLVMHRNISYGPYGEYNLLDIYYPEKPVNESGLFPVLVDVHGGGFFYGDKELYRFYCMDMALRGFLVVNFNYRLSPEYRFPNQVIDVNEVMRFIEAHATQYPMDLSRVYMMGDSAGAHLAFLYGVLNTNPDFAALYPIKKPDIAVKKLVLACGLYDVMKCMYEDKEKTIYQDYLGELYGKPNPMFYIIDALTANYPETYVFSCPNDFLYSECEPLAQRIKACGGKVTSKIYGTSKMQEIGHVFHLNLRLPLGKTAREDIATFLNQD